MSACRDDDFWCLFWQNLRTLSILSIAAMPFILWIAVSSFVKRRFQQPEVTARWQDMYPVPPPYDDDDDNDSSDDDAIAEADDALRHRAAALQHDDDDNDVAVSPDEECIVCMHRRRRLVLVPCGHLCYCTPCHERVYADNRDACCPMCKAAVRETIRVYA
jgi:hypothetical protein